MALEKTTDKVRKQITLEKDDLEILEFYERKGMDASTAVRVALREMYQNRVDAIVKHGVAGVFRPRVEGEEEVTYDDPPEESSGGESGVRVGSQA